MKALLVAHIRPRIRRRDQSVFVGRAIMGAFTGAV
jgi:uncharacterized membrane protein